MENVIIESCYFVLIVVGVCHWLNMELDLQSLFGLLFTAVLIGLDPAKPLLPPHLGSFSKALLVSQDRRHLFVTPGANLQIR